jgi:hypothetical protein
VLDGVFQGQDSAFGLGFVSHVGVSLFHAHLCVLLLCKVFDE